MGLFDWLFGKRQSGPPVPATVHDPVFGRLENDGGWWCGRMWFPALAACQIRWRLNDDERLVRSETVSQEVDGRVRVVVHDEADDGPDDPQRAAYRFLEKNQDQVVANVLAALVRHTNHDYIIGSPFQSDAQRLGLVSANGVRELVELCAVYFLEPSRDKESYVTFEFGCCFDEEHGISVLIHHGQVVATSLGDDFTQRDRNNLEAHAQFCREIGG